VSAGTVAAAVAGELAAEGFPRLPAQVLMALTARQSGSMTAAELAETLEVSPAAVSGAIRYLGVLGFVRVTTVPGTRRHVYSLPALPWYASTLTQARYAPMLLLLEGGLHEVEPGPARDRLAEMADFFRFLQAELPLLWQRWQQSRP
jgi:hypothetical protein